MALTHQPPTSPVVGIIGAGISVTLGRVPGQANDVDLHITRNGKAEHRFSMSELQQVLQTITDLLPHAHAQKPPAVAVGINPP